MSFQHKERVTVPLRSERRIEAQIVSGPHRDDPELGTYYKVHSGLMSYDVAARFIRHPRIVKEG